MDGYVICEGGSPTCTTISECGVAAGCFLGGTLIETTKGMMRIEDIMVGDILIGRDESGGLVNPLVIDTHKYLQNEYLTINGSVEVSSTHPFMLNGKWGEAGDIKEGDYLIDRQGRPLLVSSIEWINKGVRVYNVSLGGAHTFFAAGLLVHNKAPNLGG